MAIRLPRHDLSVFVGFMLFAVYSSFGEADLNVDLEANAVVDIYRLADGMPEPQSTQLQKLARSCVDAVIIQEWRRWTKVWCQNKPRVSTKRCGRR